MWWRDGLASRYQSRGYVGGYKSLMSGGEGSRAGGWGVGIRCVCGGR